MGRGRQKAKQTKVARQLKYFSPNTDYTALQRELGGSTGAARIDHAVDDDLVEHDEADETPEEDDDSEDEDDEYAGWSAHRGV